MSIASKLALVMGEVQRVEKSGHNDFHKYSYATEADIVEAIRGSLSKHGVAFIPTVRNISREGDITATEMEFRFIDGESGEAIISTFWGFGQDKTDKGAYKAYTGAVKYCLMKTFLVPTGDDPEADDQSEQKPTSTKPAPRKPEPPASPPKPPQPPTEPPAKPALPNLPGATINEAQRKRLFAIAKQNGYSVEKIKAVLMADYKIESSTAILCSDYEKVVEKFSKPEEVANA